MKTLKNLCLITGLLLAFSSCKKNESTSSPSQPEKKMQLSSVGRLLISSKTFQGVDPLLLKECLTELNISKIDEETYVQPFPMKGLSIILSSGKRIDPNIEGSLYLSEDDFKHMNSFQVYYKDVLMPIEDFRYIKKERAIIFETTVQKYLAKRTSVDDKINCHSDTKNRGTETSGSRKSMGRCIDYNGYMSDGGNYPISDWRSSRNFIGSDCDIAMARGYCWTEHVVSGGCYKTHNERSCSSLIGHSDDYHPHTFWNRSRG